jgi:hypothetical protein
MAIIASSPSRTSPTLQPGHMMVFIDGENLTLRYQDMQASGRIPHANVVHKKDTFVWRGGTIKLDLNLVLRATYYTYAFGSEEQVEIIRNHLKGISFKRDIIFAKQPLYRRSEV